MNKLVGQLADQSVQSVSYTRQLYARGAPVLVMDTLPSRIVQNRDPLAEGFLPVELLGREQQVEQMLALLRPVSLGQPAVRCWVHGPPGSGKTVLVRKVLCGLEREGIRTALVNCFEARSVSGVLGQIVDELRVVTGATRERSKRLATVIAVARKQPLVLGLDDLNALLPADRSLLMLNLARIGPVGLVCSTGEKAAYWSLEPKVQSRLQPLQFVELPEYSRQQLLAILADRAEEALRPASWSMADLEQIASGSRGNAGAAVASLGSASYAAEKHRIARIQPGDTARALEQSRREGVPYLLEKLSDHHRLLYRILEQAGELTSTQLWKRYRAEAPTKKLPAMERRTISRYTQKLVVAGLVYATRAKGLRNTKLLRVVRNG